MKYFELSLFSFLLFCQHSAAKVHLTFLSLFVVLFCSLEKSESTISKLQEQLKKEKGRDVILLKFLSVSVRFCRQNRSENRKINMKYTDKAEGDYRKARKTIYFLRHCNIVSLQSSTKN